MTQESMDESSADRDSKIVAEAVLVVAREGEDENATALLQGVLPRRAIDKVESEG